MEENCKTQSSFASWIVSLAISITCCAILFVVFAGFLTEIKKSIADADQRLKEMSAHNEQMLAEIRSLHKELASNVAIQPPPGMLEHGPMPPPPNGAPMPNGAPPAMPPMPPSNPAAMVPGTDHAAAPTLPAPPAPPAVSPAPQSGKKP